MSFAVVLALLLALLEGCLSVEALWPAPAEGGWADRSLRLFLGAGLGMGISSALFFIASLVFAAPALPSAAAEGGLALFLAGFVYCSRGRPSFTRKEGQAGRKQPWRTRDWVLASVFAQMSVLALVVAIRAARTEPYGSWDGWAIWNMLARFIFRAGTHWPELLRAPEIAWAHPDYPFVVPAAVARAWSWAGADTPGASAAVSLVFGAATVGLLVSALIRSRGPAAGFLGGIVLLGTPFFVHFSTNEHADIPLGFTLLAACVLIAEPADGSGRRSPAVLAGLFTGMAGAVKNEGLLLGLVLLAVWLAASRSPGGARSAGRFLAGLLAALSPVLYFKLRLAPPNDLMAGRPAGSLALLFDASRHSLILQALRRDIPGFGEWAVAPFLAMALCLVGPGWRTLTRREWAAGAVTLSLLAGYYAVYLLTPHDLAWQLRYSLVRLLLQLWPAAIFFWGLVLTLPGGARAPVSGSPRLRFARWAAANVVLGAVALLAADRQSAPNEIAFEDFHRVSVAAGDGWYDRETHGPDTWLWSKGASILDLQASSPRSVRLSFELRSLSPCAVVATVGGREIWRAQVGTNLERFRMPLLALPEGTTEMEFAADRPGTPETNRPGARTLAFALYDLRLE